METSAFHTTRWTLVRNAHGETPEAREALRELCANCYAPVLAFLQRDGRNEDAARELAHGFFAQLLSGNAIGEADRGRGRFRSYLLGAVKHYLANRKRSAAREKRGGAAEHHSLDEDTGASPDLPFSGGSALSADAAFDRDWALTIIGHALETLEHESEDPGHFAALRPWLTPGGTPSSQEETAARLGMSEGALKVAIHRLRKRFRSLVRAEVAQTLHDPADLNDEMRHLVDALASP